MLAEWQVRLQKLKANRLFETIVLIIILLSALLVGVDTYDEVIHPDFKVVMELLDFGVSLFFLVEILIRFLAEENKKAFFKNGWNIFDTVIDGVIEACFVHTVSIEGFHQNRNTRLIISPVGRIRHAIRRMMMLRYYSIFQSKPRHMIKLFSPVALM